MWLRVLCLFVLLFWTGPLIAEDLNLTGHIKYQPSISKVPASGVRREVGPSTLHGQEIDLRINAEYFEEEFSAIIHAETLGSGGTEYESTQKLNQLLGRKSSSALDDDRKLFDLSVQSLSDQQFQMYHRLDRAEIGYYGKELVVRAGRQAYSLGRGRSHSAWTRRRWLDGSRSISNRWNL